MKLKIYNVVIITILFALLLQAQTKKDYKKLYKEFLKEAKSEHEFEKKSKDFFKQFNDEELAVAISNISRDEDVNFIAQNVFIPNKSKLDEGNFRKKLFKNLTKNKKHPNYQYVVIDFISKYNKKDDEYIEEFNDELFRLANSYDTDDNIKGYATSKYGISKNFNKVHNNFKKLFNENNLSVKKGVAKSLTRFLYTDKISDAEKDNWENLLISEIENNKHNLQEVDLLINTLSKTKSHKSKNYLLKLFKANAKTNPENTNLIVNNLLNEIDTDIFNNIFTEYHNNIHYNNFGSELQLKRLVNENESIIDNLYKKKDKKSRLNFLKAVRHINSNKKKNRLEQVKACLSSKSEIERLESIKTLHFLLPHKEEITLFRNHLKNEHSYLVKTQIYSYIGK